jgi:hypothetical protein
MMNRPSGETRDKNLGSETVSIPIDNEILSRKSNYSYSDYMMLETVPLLLLKVKN